MKKNRKGRNTHIFLVLIVLLLTLSSNSWREIPKYYKNMIYVSSFNGLYYLLCRRHLVWEFIPDTGVPWMLLRFVHTLLVSPLLVLVFLSKMPNTLLKQMMYFIQCVTICTAVEYFIHKKKLLQYSHSWNIFWSGILYFKMFLYSHLFTKRPAFTLSLSFCTTVFLIIIFNVPIRRKHVSRHFEPLLDLYYHTLLEDFFNDKKRLIFKT